jgi:hypothetical protein
MMIICRYAFVASPAMLRSEWLLYVTDGAVSEINDY